MRKIVIVSGGVLAIALAAWGMQSRSQPVPVQQGQECATCLGNTPCNACKNCKYCKHCAKDGGTCGICK